MITSKNNANHVHGNANMNNTKALAQEHKLSNQNKHGNAGSCEVPIVADSSKSFQRVKFEKVSRQSNLTNNNNKNEQTSRLAYSENKNNSGNNVYNGYYTNGYFINGNKYQQKQQSQQIRNKPVTKPVIKKAQDIINISEVKTSPSAFPPTGFWADTKNLTNKNENINSVWTVSNGKHTGKVTASTSSTSLSDKQIEKIIKAKIDSPAIIALHQETIQLARNNGYKSRESQSDDEDDNIIALINAGRSMAFSNRKLTSSMTISEVMKHNDDIINTSTNNKTVNKNQTVTPTINTTSKNEVKLSKHDLARIVCKVKDSLKDVMHNELALLSFSNNNEISEIVDKLIGEEINKQMQIDIHGDQPRQAQKKENRLPSNYSPVNNKMLQRAHKIIDSMHSFEESVLYYIRARLAKADKWAQAIRQSILVQLEKQSFTEDFYAVKKYEDLNIDTYLMAFIYYDGKTDNSKKQLISLYNMINNGELQDYIENEEQLDYNDFIKFALNMVNIPHTAKVLASEAKLNNKKMHITNGNIFITHKQMNKLMHALNGNIDKITVKENNIVNATILNANKIPQLTTPEDITLNYDELNDYTKNYYNCIQIAYDYLTADDVICMANNNNNYNHMSARALISTSTVVTDTFHNVEHLSHFIDEVPARLKLNISREQTNFNLYKAALEKKKRTDAANRRIEDNNAGAKKIFDHDVKLYKAIIKAQELIATINSNPAIYKKGSTECIAINEELEDLCNTYKIDDHSLGSKPRRPNEPNYEVFIDYDTPINPIYSDTNYITKRKGVDGIDVKTYQTGVQDGKYLDGYAMSIGNTTSASSEAVSLTTLGLQSLTAYSEDTMVVNFQKVTKTLQPYYNTYTLRDMAKLLKIGNDLRIFDHCNVGLAFKCMSYISALTPVQHLTTAFDNFQHARTNVARLPDNDDVYYPLCETGNNAVVDYNALSITAKAMDLAAFIRWYIANEGADADFNVTKIGSTLTIIPITHDNARDSDYLGYLTLMHLEFPFKRIVSRRQAVGENGNMTINGAPWIDKCYSTYTNTRVTGATSHVIYVITDQQLQDNRITIRYQHNIANIGNVHEHIIDVTHVNRHNAIVTPQQNVNVEIKQFVMAKFEQMTVQSLTVTFDNMRLNGLITPRDIQIAQHLIGDISIYYKIAPYLDHNNAGTKGLCNEQIFASACASVAEQNRLSGGAAYADYHVRAQRSVRFLTNAMGQRLLDINDVRAGYRHNVYVRHQNDLSNVLLMSGVISINQVNADIRITDIAKSLSFQLTGYSIHMCKAVDYLINMCGLPMSTIFYSPSNLRLIEKDQKMLIGCHINERVVADDKIQGLVSYRDILSLFLPGEVEWSMHNVYYNNPDTSLIQNMTGCNFVRLHVTTSFQSPTATLTINDIPYIENTNDINDNTGIIGRKYLHILDNNNKHGHRQLTESAQWNSLADINTAIRRMAYTTSNNIINNNYHVLSEKYLNIASFLVNELRDNDVHVGIWHNPYIYDIAQHCDTVMYITGNGTTEHSNNFRTYNKSGITTYNNKITFSSDNFKFKKFAFTMGKNLHASPILASDNDLIIKNLDAESDRLKSFSNHERSQPPDKDNKELKLKEALTEDQKKLLETINKPTETPNPFSTL